VIEFLLLNQSCDVQIQAKDGSTALHYLVRHFPSDSNSPKAEKYIKTGDKIVQRVHPPSLPPSLPPQPSQQHGLSFFFSLDLWRRACIPTSATRGASPLCTRLLLLAGKVPFDGCSAIKTMALISTLSASALGFPPSPFPSLSSPTHHRAGAATRPSTWRLLRCTRKPSSSFFGSFVID